MPDIVGSSNLRPATILFLLLLAGCTKTPSAPPKKAVAPPRTIEQNLKAALDSIEAATPLKVEKAEKPVGAWATSTSTTAATAPSVATATTLSNFISFSPSHPHHELVRIHPATSSSEPLPDNKQRITVTQGIEWDPSCRVTFDGTKYNVANLTTHHMTQGGLEVKVVCVVDAGQLEKKEARP